MKIRLWMALLLMGTGCGGATSPTGPGGPPPAARPGPTGRPYLFDADDRTHGRELWRSDGTTAGTALLKDISGGSAASYFGQYDMAPPWYVSVGGLDYFFVLLGRRELWRTDGTEAGTVRVHDFGPFRNTRSPQFEYPRQLTALGGTFFFVIDDGEHGTELWRSDGTEAGTRLVEDLAVGRASSPIDNVVATGRQLFVTVGSRLLRCDERGPLTLLATYSAGVRSIHAFADGALFSSSQDLYRTDGTPQGTVRLLHLDATFPSTVVASAERGFFFAPRSNSTVDDVWVTDGTSAGTSRFGSFPRGPRSVAVVGGRLFIAACRDFARPCEVWSTDGTEQGTVQVLSSNNGSFTDLVMVGGQVLFRSYEDGPGGPVSGLWAVGANGRGARRILQASMIDAETLREVDGVLFFRAGGPGQCTTLFCDLDLWRTDGTEEGTVMIRAFPPG
jgi:ELWxxDGT repeat protein